MFIEIMAVEKHHKYVGLPTIISNSKTQGLPKSKNLKPKFLNLLKKESGRMKLIKMMEGESVIKGSKEVLIKAVVDQAILTYVMGCFISLL